MIRPRFFHVGLIALAALPAPAGACRVELRAEAPVALAEGFAVAPARLGGRAVSMVLDTGAEGMLVTPDVADALGLRRDPARRVRVLGTGGPVVAEVAALPTLEFGGLAWTALSAPVVAVPGLPAADPAVAGLIGAPVLAGHDLDLDLPRGRVRLHDVRDCPDGIRPFAPPYVMLPMRLSASRQPLVPVLVNGVELRAVLDTGSRGTVLTEEAARRAGLGRPLREDVTSGVDGAATPMHWHRTRELRVGWEALPEMVVGVAALDGGEADMLLGMDYLAARRVWVSYAGGRVFLQAPGWR